MIVFIIYLALGYWAVGETVYKNKVLFSTEVGGIFLQKIATALVIGWICIPIAIIKLIISGR